jgi:disulfide oxidoreductase YuzD
MARCRGLQLGDAVNGIVAEAVVGSAQEAAEWLRANAVRRYPHSEFARLYPRPANDP